MVNCSHNPEDVECITLFLVGFLAAAVTFVIFIAVICYIVKRKSKKRRDNLKCADENPADVLTKVIRQCEPQGSTNIAANIEDYPNVIVEQNCRNNTYRLIVFCTFAGSTNTGTNIEDNSVVQGKQNCQNDAQWGSTNPGANIEDNSVVQGKQNCWDVTQGGPIYKGAKYEEDLATNVKDGQNCRTDKNGGSTNPGANIEDNSVVQGKQYCRNDTQGVTDKQKPANHVEKPSKAKDNRKRVFVLLKDSELRVCMETLLKGTGLKPNYLFLDTEQTFNENGKVQLLGDKTSTIIVVRHGSTRIDSDIEGCCTHVADSDMKRTVVVIINEYANNKKGEHGEIIKPNNYVTDILIDLKNAFVFNYKCCMEKTKCGPCKNAMDEFKQYAKSPNYT